MGGLVATPLVDRRDAGDPTGPIRECLGGSGMELGMYGLGRMGANMVKRLLRVGTVWWSTTAVRTGAGCAAGAPCRQRRSGTGEPPEPPRVVWLMLPAGEVTETAIEAVSLAGVMLVDGATATTATRCARRSGSGLHYVDVGTSGGIWGVTEGYSLMIGGDEERWRLRPLRDAGARS